MGGFAKRGLGSFGIHLLLAAMVAGLIFWITSSFENASETLRSQLAETEDANAAVLTYLAAARGQLIVSLLIATLFSWFASCLFLIICERTNPETETQGGQRLGLWGLLLVLVLLFAILIWWLKLSVPDVGMALVSGNYALALALGFLAVLLSYFLGTALMVKRTMKPSVPLAVVLKGME